MNQTMRAALNVAKQALTTVSPTPALDAEILLAHSLQITRVQLFVDLLTMLPATAQLIFQELLARRLKGEPVAYLVGYREFWSLPFNVTTATLIPRPETEMLVQCALDYLPAQGVCTVADLGTGSGAIAVALASERAHWQIIATDQSSAALQIAQQNAAKFKQADLRFYQGDWCAALPAGLRFDAIVSNPPYIDAEDPCWHAAENGFEPTSALLAPAAGMADLHTIIKNARAHLKPGGWLMLEHGYNQHSAVNNLLRNYGYCAVNNLPDLANIMRVTVAQFI